MKKLIGDALITIGLVAGIFVGGYLMLYGGIIQIINAINPVNASGIAIGIIRVLFSGLGFYIPFIFGYCYGYSIKYN